MEYVTATAPTREAAELLLKRQYGNDVKIFSSKKVERRTGLLRRRSVIFEVTGYRPSQRPQKSSPDKTHKSDDAARERDEIRRQLTGILEENEFPPKAVRQILDQLASEAEEDELQESFPAENRLLSVISDMLKRRRSSETPSGRLTVLIGPTGTGKTTTAAKLAALFGALERLKEVRLFTIDTYRIGAKAQIETFGELMRVPVITLRSQDAMHAALQEHAGADHIIIDTMGKSPKDTEIRQEMLDLLQPCREVPGMQVLLALSASMKGSDMVKTAARFEEFGIDGLVITKLDETGSVGELIWALEQIGLPVCYITDGQRVPQDIHRMHEGVLMQRLSGFSVDLGFFSQIGEN